MVQGQKDKELSGGIIPLHFDVPDHALPLDQFILIAQSTEAIVENFNKEVFDNKLKYKLMVRSPQKGGLIEVLQLIVYGGAPVWAFLNTPVGRAYVDQLTGKTPEEWARDAAELTKEYLADDNSISDDNRAETVKEKEEHNFLENTNTEATQNIVSQMTLSFLEKTPEELESIGYTKSKFRSAYSGRNNIYQSCLQNQDVKGIGFDFSHDFKIQRSKFSAQIILLPDEIEVPDEEDHWIVETVDVKVNSPNWKREGRKWQAEYGEGREVWFSIEDDTFWHHVRIKDIQPDINDNMKVQWAYPSSLNHSKVRVLRVLTYNGKELSQKLEGSEIEQKLGLYLVENDDQHDLFD